MPLIESIREVRDLKSLPIILITDELAPDTLNTLLAMGIDVLFRPYGAPMLRARVRAWLARSFDQRRERSPNGQGGPKVERRAARRELKSDVVSGILDEGRAVQAGAAVRSLARGRGILPPGPAVRRHLLHPHGHGEGADLRPGRHPDPARRGGPGDMVGEMGALDSGLRSATVVAEYGGAGAVHAPGGVLPIPQELARTRRCG